MISQKEYEKLKGLGDHWEWMARDENGQLYKYMDKPRKINDFNWNDPAETWSRMNDDGFKFIQFSDSEPYSIVELIEEYEYSSDHVSHVLNERVKALGNAWKESEETEVKKDKEDLIKYLKKEIGNFNPGQMIYDYLTFILKQLKQLEEPEVLSQEWIDENKVARIDNLKKMTTHDVVSVDKLKDLLVPKQEEVDRVYKDGYEKGKERTFYKGYLEGLADKESINPERSPEVDQHKELLDELNDLYARKNQDYGNSFDESLDEDGLLVLKIRLGDKYKRFSTLINQKNEVIDESMRDTLIDLANYALMGVMWMDKNEEEE